MKKIQIDITGNQEITVEAYVHGKFAVNLPPYVQMVNPAEARWHITHIATGLCIKRVWGRAAARSMARELDAAVETDITPVEYAARGDAYRAFGAAVAAVLKGETHGH